MKRLLLLFLATPLSVVASASPPNTLVTELLACRHIAPDAARLTCLDRVLATLAPTSESSPARSSSAAPAMKDALDPQHTFGLSHATIVEREASSAGIHVKELSHITARVVRMQQGPDGSAIFDLDNGQVWQQLGPDGTDVYTKAGDSVEISRGLLGSYWLEAPFGQRCNVVRVR